MILRTLILAGLATAGLAPAADASPDHDRHDRSRAQVGLYAGSQGFGVGVTVGPACRQPYARPIYRRPYRPLARPIYRPAPRPAYRYDRCGRPIAYWCGYHRAYHDSGRIGAFRPNTVCRTCRVVHPCAEYRCRVRTPRCR